MAQLSERAAAVANDIEMLKADRDKLLAKCQRLIAENAMAKDQIDQLNRKLTAATSERDHYMRFGVEIITQLNNITLVIGQANASAKQAAYRPNNPAPIDKGLKGQSVEEQRLLENLARALAPIQAEPLVSA